MSIGVSTACLYPMPTEQALYELARRGIKTTEVFLNSGSELETDFLKKFVEIKNGYGLRIVAIHPYTSAFEAYMLFSEYKRRFEDTLEYYKKYYAAANILGAKIVVLHGGYKQSHIEDEVYIERIAALIAQGKSQGITVAHENVNLYKCSDPEFVLKLKETLGDEIKFVLDIKQAIRAGHSPLSMLEAMGRALVHIHLSDNTNTESCLLPGRGSFDFRVLFSKLEEMQYTGDGVVEVYRSAFGSVEELIRSAKELQKLYLKK